jgi:hypothetical protein
MTQKAKCSAHEVTGLKFVCCCHFQYFNHNTTLLHLIVIYNTKRGYNLPPPPLLRILYPVSPILPPVLEPARCIFLSLDPLSSILHPVPASYIIAGREVVFTKHVLLFPSCLKTFPEALQRSYYLSNSTCTCNSWIMV